MKENVFLYGAPGVGKSTLGRKLAESLNIPFVDLDSEIEIRAGVPIPEIFSTEGEAGFRHREQQILGEVVSRGRQVIALGGGALLDPTNRIRAEAAGYIVCLAAEPEVLANRLRQNPVQRPLLSNAASHRLAGLLTSRAEHYASFPLRLDTSHLEFDQVVWEIQVKLGWFYVRGMAGWDRHERTLAVSQPVGYEVRVQPGGLESLGEILKIRGFKSPMALVSDENVGPLHAGRALTNLRRSGFEVGLLTIPAKEVDKNVATVSRLWLAFLEAGLERSSPVLALGGGVVGDMAGFAAATYLRGVPLIMLPSSLLAMVDASLGGKTGVDLPQGKNLVGAFYPPRLVLIDPDLLTTLPDEELSNGMAEVVKHGIIGDVDLFALCSQGWKALAGNWPQLISRAIAVKIKIIQEDPYEAGPRATLNLGHTFGHALELISGYQISHGKAVAIGTVAEARLAENLGIAQKGLAEEVAAVLAGLGLPTKIPPEISQAALMRAIAMDKKRADGVVHFSLPVRVGEVIQGVPVTDILVRSLYSQRRRGH